MTWRYQADGGEYTVSEAELRSAIADGTLSGDARVLNLDDGQWRRVDVDFTHEFRSATFAAGKRAHQERQARRGFFARNYRGLTALVVLAIGIGSYWWSNRITCSRPDVKRVATRLVKEKLLKLTSGDINLVNIATLGSLDSGGVKCSADVEVTGGPDGTNYQTVSYSAERQGDSIAVVGRMER